MSQRSFTQFVICSAAWTSGKPRGAGLQMRILAEYEHTRQDVRSYQNIPLLYCKKLLRKYNILDERLLKFCRKIVLCAAKSPRWERHRFGVQRGAVSHRPVKGLRAGVEVAVHEEEVLRLVGPQLSFFSSEQRAGARLSGMSTRRIAKIVAGIQLKRC